MDVDRCVCFDVTLETMRDYARAHESTFEDLRSRFGCGRGCGLCVPYVQLMLETGRTRFPLDAVPDPDHAA